MSPPTPVRRRALLTAAWAAPAAVATTAAPAIAASSDCYTTNFSSTAYVSIVFRNLTRRGVWQQGSTVSTQIFLGTPGNLAPPGSGGLSFSSDTSGVQTTLTGFTRVITSSFRLSFAHVDDWEITEQTGQGGTYRYTFEHTGDDITRQAVNPLGSVPSQNSPANTLNLIEFPVTVPAGTFSTGDNVLTYYQFTVHDTILWTEASGRPSCDGDRQFAGSFSFSVFPASS